MRIYVARHGEAGDFSPDPETERARDLSSSARADVARVAAVLKKRSEDPLIIFASPFQRTLTTAFIFGKVLGVPVTTEEDLQPDRDVIPWLLDLLDDGEMRHVMIVGHHDNLVPALQRLAPEGVVVDKFAKGEARRLKFNRDDGSWIERYRVLPDRAQY